MTLKLCSICGTMKHIIKGDICKRCKPIQEETNYMKTHNRPRCINCHRDFINGIDSKTGKISKHIWVSHCSCKCNQGKVLMRG